MQIRAYLALAIGVLLLPTPAMSTFMTSAEEFAVSQGVAFTWHEAQARSAQIFLEYRDPAGAWHRVNVGTGFLLSQDGLFITAYHVMKYCLAGQREASRLSAKVDCSTASPGIRYVAINDGGEFAVEVISHLQERESISGKKQESPDEIIKQRDFVVGKLNSDTRTFSYWRLRDFDDRAIDLSSPSADFQLTPMLPPKRVFIAGFSENPEFVISEGFLNLSENNQRGYFAVDMKLYTEPYLHSQGVAPDAQWGIRVENHMSGGAVVDSSGYVVGLLVTGNQKTAGVLSIENVLSTFFSRESEPDLGPAVLLNPSLTPLFLKRQLPRTPTEEILPPSN